MADRRKKRFARRLQVRFWKQGEQESRSAYTTNVSTSGMYIATNSPLPPGSRVRVELMHDTDGFMLEGEVAHAARVSPLLAQIKSSGMGVRFLSVPELIAEILPASERLRLPEEPEEVVPSGTEIEAATDPETEPPPATPTTPPATVRPEPARAVPAGGSTRPPPEKLKMREGRVLHLRFESLPHFLKVMQRDIASGGIFVPNASGVEIDQRVKVDLHLPPPVDQIVRLAGRVVHVVAADPDEENLLAGAGVQLSETQIVTRQLERLIYSE